MSVFKMTVEDLEVWLRSNKKFNNPSVVRGGEKRETKGYKHYYDY